MNIQGLSFQAGHRALVAAIRLKEPTEPGLLPTGPKSLVFGDTNVEWTLRTVDPDGTETGGDLVRAGIVSHATRTSSIVMGVVAGYSSSTFNE